MTLLSTAPSRIELVSAAAAGMAAPKQTVTVSLVAQLAPEDTPSEPSCTLWDGGEIANPTWPGTLVEDALEPTVTDPNAGGSGDPDWQMLVVVDGSTLTVGHIYRLYGTYVCSATKNPSWQCEIVVNA